MAPFSNTSEELPLPPIPGTPRREEPDSSSETNEEPETPRHNVCASPSPKSYKMSTRYWCLTPEKLRLLILVLEKDVLEDLRVCSTDDAEKSKVEQQLIRLGARLSSLVNHFAVFAVCSYKHPTNRHRKIIWLIDFGSNEDRGKEHEACLRKYLSTSEVRGDIFQKLCAQKQVMKVPMTEGMLDEIVSAAKTSSLRDLFVYRDDTYETRRMKRRRSKKHVTSEETAPAHVQESRNTSTQHHHSTVQSHTPVHSRTTVNRSAASSYSHDSHSSTDHAVSALHQAHHSHCD